MADLVAFKRRDDEERRKVLAELTAEAQNWDLILIDRWRSRHL